MEDRKQIFERDDSLRCPHCGNIAAVNSKGKPSEIADYIDTVIGDDNPVTWSGDFPWDWTQRCDSCGKKINIEVVFMVTK